MKPSPHYSAVRTEEEYPSYPTGPTTPSTGNPRKTKLIWALTILISLVAIAQWLLTLFTVIKHFNYSSGSNPRTQTYTELPLASSNPSSIAPDMPSTCLSWLSSSAGVTAIAQLTRIDLDTQMAVFISLAQFGFCTITLVSKGATMLFSQRSRRYPSLPSGRPRRFLTFNMLTISAAATLSTLGLSALVVGVWVLVTVVLKGGFINLAYTNNGTVTGGCTFAAVTMSKRWGYYDVENERAFRAVMSLLGAG
jgi:hypothetical protein